MLASTVSGPAARDLAAYTAPDSGGAHTIVLAGETWAVQPLSQLGDVTFLALASIDAAAAAGQTQAALRSLAWVGLGAIALAVLGSVWLALRYERPGTIGLRFDAGQFSSPIGLSILENRPDKNPVISQHSTLYLPIPRYETGTPSTTLLGAAYPLGAKVTVSGAKWDARAAVLDSSPIRGRPFFGANKPPRMANVVFGGGVTPVIGLRFGVAFGTGPYAAAREVRDKTRGDRRATVTQVEGEWAFRYTRIAGEFLWTTRQLATSDAHVDGGWIEVTQTLSPRVFAVVRYDDQWTEWASVVDFAERYEPYRRVETTAGFKITPEITIRGSYLTRKGYVVGFWDDQVLASVVIAKRLFR